MALLEADRISRVFPAGQRHTLALPEVTLTVDPAEFLVITGPSGAGKSTLLNLLAGLDRPSSGTVRFRGQNLTAMREREVAELRNSSFGFIFQTPHLLADRTVSENVSLPFHYGRLADPGEIRDRCHELLDHIGMAELAERFPPTLSGGEMQRVVFARALMRRPAVIFADEPTGNLDADNSMKLLRLLQEQASQGCTVIMVTHDPDAVRYGSRVVRLAKPPSAR